jgi:multicomponent Na+:H+ antiporter subunit G
VIQLVIGRGIILLGLLFIATGIYSVLAYKEFYSRVVITAKVDTVGFISVLVGIIVLEGFSFFALKVLIILIFEMLTSPMSTHAIAHSAYVAGYRVERELPRD